MRTAPVLVLLTPLLTSGARGQVSVDMHALDGAGPTHAAPAHRSPAHHRATAAATAHSTTQAAIAHPATQPTPSTTGNPGANPSNSRVAEDHPAPTPVAAPTPALPTQQPAPPPASTIVPAPSTHPLPLPPPVRLVFEAGKTELTPTDEAAIQDLARAIPTQTADSINVVAYAAGKADDPSTARRLSLSRGLAVRSVLLASGIPSAQIYVRALGSTPSNGPADRVELIVAPIGTVVR